MKVATAATTVLFTVSMSAMVAYAGGKAVIVTEDSSDILDDFEPDMSSFSKIIDLSSIKEETKNDVVIYCPSMPSSENVTVVPRYSDNKLLLVWKEGRDDYFLSNSPEGKLDHVEKFKLSGNGKDVYFTFELDSMCECRVDFDNRDIKLDFVPVTEDETVIAIDPGHGGAQNGVMVGKLTEKEIVLSIAERVKKLAKDKPYRVILIRDGDYTLNQADRLKEIEALNASYYISLHTQADTDDERVYGMSAGYNGNYYREGLSNVSFADAILRNACESAKNRGVELINESEDEMLKVMTIPAMNLYVGYLSNRDEGVLLSRSDYCDRIAEGILAGLDKTVGK